MKNFLKQFIFNWFNVHDLDNIIIMESVSEAPISKLQDSPSDLRIDDIICNTFNDGFRRIGRISL